jgi:hypothetical protein
LKSVTESLPAQTRMIIGSHIVPATWVHGFPWKQWRAGLARDFAMFIRSCKAQPRQALESPAGSCDAGIARLHNVLISLRLTAPLGGQARFRGAEAQVVTELKDDGGRNCARRTIC